MVDGLRVLVCRHPGPLTAISLSIRAGARWDGDSPGLAHLTEHMLFQGTEQLDQLALTHRAAELGGEHNAETSYEEIALTFEVFNEDVGAALDLLAQQYYRPLLSPHRLANEKRVVVEEVRGHLEDPGERLAQAAWARLFDGALAHPVGGTVGSVRRIRASEVRSFVDRRFVHENSVLVLVGGAAPAEVLRAVRSCFGRGRHGQPATPPPVRLGPGSAFRLRDRRAGQAYLTRLFAVDPHPRTVLATGVALDILGGDPDARLFQEVRERLGLGYDVGAHLEWGPDWAAASISASGLRAEARRLCEAVDRTLAGAARSGFSDQELARARKKLRYRYARLEDSRVEKAACLAESMLWGAPTPRAALKIVAELTREEIENAWRAAFARPGVRGLLC